MWLVCVPKRACCVTRLCDWLVTVMVHSWSAPPSASLLQLLSVKFTASTAGRGNLVQDCLNTVPTRTPCAQVEETFDWAQQWYPLFFVADLSTTQPTPVQLLGKDLVIWRAPDGAWSALEDLCPHRLAPLSRAPPRSPLIQSAADCLACPGPEQKQCLGPKSVSRVEALPLA